jgi:hypothetical protein
MHITQILVEFVIVVNHSQLILSFVDMNALNRLIVDAYASRREINVSESDMQDAMLSLSNEYLKSSNDVETENVGRLASLINAYFESTSNPTYYPIYNAYIESYHMFLRLKRVVDEQQWIAFYHIMKEFHEEVEVNMDIFPMIRDCMYDNVPSYWRSDKTKVQVLTLQCMIDPYTVCL